MKEILIKKSASSALRGISFRSLKYFRRHTSKMPRLMFLCEKCAYSSSPSQFEWVPDLSSAEQHERQDAKNYDPHDNSSGRKSSQGESC